MATTTTTAEVPRKSERVLRGGRREEYSDNGLPSLFAMSVWRTFALLWSVSPAAAVSHKLANMKRAWSA